MIGRWIRFAIWLGLIAWLIELAELAIGKFGFARMRFFYPEALLLGPLAYVLLFAVCGAVFGIIVRTWPRPWVQRTATALIIAAAVGSPLLHFVKSLGWWPVIILSIGAGVELSRHVIAREAGVNRLVRRSFLPLAVVILILAIAPTVYRGVRERSAFAALPDAAPRAPNVLLIILDTVRSWSLSAYGYERDTSPNLERLAARGVRFDLAVPTAPWTLPSHASIFTGLQGYELGAYRNEPLEHDFPTIAEALRDNGYATAGFVANLYYTSHEFGLSRGFLHYEDFPLMLGQIVVSFAPGRAVTNYPYFRRLLRHEEPFNNKDATRITSDFLDWSEDQQRPYFAFLNYMDAHDPYTPPEPFRSRFERGEVTALHWYDTHRAQRVREDEGTPFTQAEIDAQLGAYDGEIAYLDSQLGRMFAELERRGELDNTIVIVTSDHGEEFQENGMVGHARSLHMSVLSVPLIIAGTERVPRGVTVQSPVSLRHLPATIMDLAGFHAPKPFPGRSLASDFATDTVGAPEPILSEMGLHDFRSASLVLGGRHYVIPVERDSAVYDLSADPFERFDLIGSDTGQSMVAQLRPILEQQLAGKRAKQRELRGE